jgi:spore coat polysaccharide biosynthesis protein SpsF (cytidylyltransferase family)
VADPKVVAIVQARMTSQRLPGKVLADLGGRPVLGWVTSRLALAETVEQVLVATSTDKYDDPVAAWCEQAGFECFRGSLDDVLARFVDAAAHVEAGVIVRITADCPLIDPGLVDQVVQRLLDDELDYCGLGGEFPDGLDCEAMTFGALLRSHDEAGLLSEREHVTPYLKRPGAGFRTGSVEPFVGLQNHRWTLDRPRDLAFLREIVARSEPGPGRPTTEEVLAILASDPSIATLNAGIVRNEGYLQSRDRDGGQDGAHVV